MILEIFNRYTLYFFSVNLVACWRFWLMEWYLRYTGTFEKWKILRSFAVIGNEGAPIQLAQCRFPGLAISTAKILTYFSTKIYISSFIKWYSETVMVRNYRNADGSLRKTIIVSFIIICGSLCLSHAQVYWFSYFALLHKILAFPPLTETGSVGSRHSPWMVADNRPSISTI